MTYILCLAHYCDTHGPTPLMVTEGLPAACSVCYDNANPAAHDARPPSTAAQSPAAISDALRDLSLARSTSFAASEDASSPAAVPRLRTGTGAASPSSALDTPPDSPRPLFQQPRRDSSYRRTYDETVTKRQGPCDNCAMTLPRRQQNSSGALDTQAGGPTLRTRAPAERVFGAAGQASPPNSQSSSDTDGEPSRQPRPRKLSSSAASSRTTSRSTASTSSERPPFHTHYLDYTSTHEPVVPASFSLLRASCLRALSFETLPRAPSTAQQPSASPIPNPSPSFVTTQSAGSAATGGPIFFGDALAGYTTAYIFRIPDVHARGHKRVYAFIALSTHKERLAMRTFAIISSAFRDLATWIQTLAEAEAERVASTSPVSSVLYSASGGGMPSRPPAVERGESSYLTGGSAFTRRMGAGGGASALRARGLAELVGQPDFFIELHRRFVQLLFEVGVTLSS